MFAFLGLGWGELIVLGVIGAILAGVVILVITLVKATSRPAIGSSRLREMRMELDRLRSENEELREEVERLRGGRPAAGDTGITGEHP